MHKFVASLLLALAATALLSSPQATSSSSATHESARFTTRVIAPSGPVGSHQVVARTGDYFDLHLEGNLLLSVRVAALDATGADIDAIVARHGLTLSEPSLRVARNATASIELGAPPLTVQFDVR